ncbi:hypothetical protein PR048_014047 [Dryococelus australis]|uniref:Uncharacterized protein n=1 Tax=Dryococelus australis TaxID=614101 RepID=A0ABQ9HUU1_9NEOP|nr:hypothetical protein PR048_014047 [Dryococelus australis]
MCGRERRDSPSFLGDTDRQLSGLGKQRPALPCGAWCKPTLQGLWVRPSIRNGPGCDEGTGVVCVGPEGEEQNCGGVETRGRALVFGRVALLVQRVTRAIIELPFTTVQPLVLCATCTRAVFFKSIVVHDLLCGDSTPIGIEELRCRPPVIRVRKFKTPNNCLSNYEKRICVRKLHRNSRSQSSKKWRRRAVNSSPRVFLLFILASHRGEPSSTPGWITPGFSQVGIVPDDAAGRQAFSGISRFPHPCIPALLHSHLIQSSSGMFLHLVENGGQLSPSTVTADNQCAVDIDICVNKTVESSLRVIELANFSRLYVRAPGKRLRQDPFPENLLRHYPYSENRLHQDPFPETGYSKTRLLRTGYG